MGQRYTSTGEIDEGVAQNLAQCCKTEKPHPPPGGAFPGVKTLGFEILKLCVEITSRPNSVVPSHRDYAANHLQ